MLELSVVGEGCLGNRFIEYCRLIEDNRQRTKVLYPIEEVLFLGLCGTLSGCEGWSEMAFFGQTHLSFLRQYSPYEHGAPCGKTICRIFCLISPAFFEDFFVSWSKGFVSSTGQTIAIDGKTLCGSNRGGKQALHMLQACLAEEDRLIAYHKTDAKSNEITAIPSLLEMINIQGHVITLDAMGCQRDICQKIIEQGGDYVIGLKGNQGSLYDDAKLLCERPEIACAAPFIQADAGHGRVEQRQTLALPTDAYFHETHQWPGLQSVAKVESLRYNKTLKKYEPGQTRYYISSLAPNAPRIAEAVRKHWKVQSLHWSLDVSFNEDNIHIAMDNAAENLAFMRRYALTLLKHFQKLQKKNISIKQLQKNALAQPTLIANIFNHNST